MKVDFKKNIRLLILDDENRMGGPDGQFVFRLNWEFWLQLTMSYDKPLTSKIMPHEAEKLAKIVEKLLSTESGQIHLYFYGDEDGEAAKLLCKFFRRGWFQIVDTAAQVPES